MLIFVVSTNAVNPVLYDNSFYVKREKIVCVLKLNFTLNDN